MTDREALERLLTRFGLAPYAGNPDGVPAEEGAVAIMAGEGGVGGYGGFYALFTFDAAGTFQALEIRE